MITWASIGFTSLRFRAALAKQGKTRLLPFKNWSYPYGPWFVGVANIFLVLLQGRSCFSPSFDLTLFFSYYIELPLMVIMFIAWKYFKKTTFYDLDKVDLVTDICTAEQAEEIWSAEIVSKLFLASIATGDVKPEQEYGLLHPATSVD